MIETRTVVGCDLVELCPMPGNVAPNFLCAKLIYKILSYRFGAGRPEGGALSAMAHWILVIIAIVVDW